MSILLAVVLEGGAFVRNLRITQAMQGRIFAKDGTFFFNPFSGEQYEVTGINFRVVPLAFPHILQ